MLAPTDRWCKGEDGRGMVGGLDEPVGERESFLGGAASAGADPDQERMPNNGGIAGGAANMRARTSRRRWREEGHAELLEESPNGARGDGDRSECEPCGARQSGASSLIALDLGLSSVSTSFIIDWFIMSFA